MIRIEPLSAFRLRNVKLRGRRGRAILQRAECGLDSGFERLRIHVANRDHRHLLGTVVRVVERAEARGRERPQDVDLADRQPVGEARVIEKDRDFLVAHARLRAEAAAPLLDHDASLLVDFLRIERQAAREIRERRKALGHEIGLVGRQIEHIHGLFEAREVLTRVWRRPRFER